MNRKILNPNIMNSFHGKQFFIAAVLFAFFMAFPNQADAQFWKDKKDKDKPGSGGGKAELVIYINGFANPPTLVVCPGGSQPLFKSDNGACGVVSHPTPRWTYTGPGTLNILDPNVDFTQIDHTGSDEGSYVLTYNMVCDGVNKTKDIDVVVSSHDTLYITLPTVDTTICEGGSVTLSAEGTDFYEWYRNGTSFSTDQTVIETPAASGNYTYHVEGTNSYGCFSNPPRDTVDVTVNPPPTVDAGGDQTICATQTATMAGVIGGSASSATWSTAGDGSFDVATNLNAVYTPGSNDIANGAVVLTLTTDDPAGPCASASDNMTLTIDPAATVEAGPNQTICETGTATMAGSVGGGASSGTWSTAGDGSFDNASNLNAVYTPGATDITNGSVVLTLTTDDPAGPCGAASDNMTITINPAATVNAGGNQTICETQTATMVGAIGGGASSSTWSTAGDGSFDNPSNLNAVYTPGSNDIANGAVVLTLTTDDPAGPCPAATSDMTLTINSAASVEAGSNQIICETGAATMNGSIGGGASSATWSTAGDGSFDNASNLNAVYTPGATDITNGSVVLTLTTDDPAGPCAASSDNMTLTINDAATVNAGGNQTICEGATATMVGVIGGGASSATWTTAGDGGFDVATNLNAVYTPGSNDIANGSVVLTLTTDDPAGPCPAVTDNMTLAINPEPTAEAGANQTICETETATMAGVIGGGASSATWTTSGDGSFDVATNLNAVYTPGVTDIANGLVVLTLTTDDPAGPCIAATDNMTLSINQSATVDAGGNQSVCGQTAVALTGIIGGSASSATWSSSGTGTFDDPGALNTNYNPSAADVTAGAVILTLTTDDPVGPCPAVSDNLTLTITTPATVDAGSDETICETQSAVALSGSFGGGATSIIWSSSGTGSFDNINDPGTNYNPSAADITAGSVVLTITTDDPDGAGPCTPATDDMTLTINQSATVDAGGNQSVCGQTAVALSGTIGGSASNATWSSSGTGTFDDPGALNTNYNPSAADVTAGTITITLTTDDPAGPCPAVTDNMTLTITTPATVSAGSDETICETQSAVALSGSFGGGATSITWSSSGTGTFDNINDPGTSYNPSAADITAGSVVLTITTDDPDGAGPCTPATDDMTLSIDPAATVNAGGNQTICEGTTATMNGSIGGGAGSATWTTGGDGAFDVSTNLNAVYTPGAGDIIAGSVVLTITTDDPSGPCGVATDNMTLTINAQATANAGANQDICEGEDATLNGSIGGAATSATWSSSGDGSFDDPGNLNAVYTPGVTDITTGTVTLTLTTDDPAGPCSAASDDMVLTIHENPSALISPDPAEACEGAPLGLNGNPSGGTLTYNHQWSGPGATYLNQDDVVDPTFTCNTAAVYSITYTVTDNYGCAATDDIDVTVNDNPTPSITPDPVDVCINDSLQILGNPAGGSGSWLSHSWTGTGQPYLTEDDVEDPYFYTTLLGGPYTLTYTVIDDNGCQGSDNVTVTVHGLPKPVASASPNPTCEGFDVTLTCNPSSSYPTYNWSGPNGFTADTSIYTLADVTVDSAGIYTVTVTDVFGCSNTSSVDLVVNPKPTALAGNDTNICWPINGGGTITLGGATPPVSGGTAPFNYTWTSIPAGFTSNDPNPTVNPPTPGTTNYILYVEDAAGCSDFDTISVGYNDILEANAGVIKTACHPLNFQDSVEIGGSGPSPTGLDGTPPYAYFWTANPPDITLNNDQDSANPLVYPLVTTDYTVEVTDANGCVADDMTTVNINNEIIAYAGWDDTVIACYDEPIVLGGETGPTDPTGVGGSGSLEYRWFPADFTISDIFAEHPTITLSVPGVYQYVVRVRDSLNCEDFDTVYVRYNDEIFVDLAFTDTTMCNGLNGGAITIGDTVSGGTPGYTYEWTTDVPYTWTPASQQFDSVITVSPAVTTQFTLNVTDAVGCEASSTTNVIVNDTVVADAGADIAMCNPANGGSANIGGAPTGSGGSGGFIYLWSESPNNGTLTGQEVDPNPTVIPDVTTTYVVAVTDANGCTDNDTIIVDVYPEFEITAQQASSGTICAGINGGMDTLSFTNVNGVEPFSTYEWSSIAEGVVSTDSVAYVTPDTDTWYTINVIDDQGCLALDSIQVQLFPILDVQIDPDVTDTTICSSFNNGSIQLEATHNNTLGAYTYNWGSTPTDLGFNDTTIQDPIVIPPAATQYDVMVTDGNGCYHSDTINVDIHEVLEALASPEGTDTIYRCQVINADSITLGFNPPYNYTDPTNLVFDWTTSGASFSNVENPNVVPAVGTWYSLTVVDTATGCGHIDSVYVDVYDTLYADAGSQSVCYGDPATLGGTPTAWGGCDAGYTYEWYDEDGNLFTSGDPNPVILNATDSTFYRLIVSDGCGCVAEDTAFINVSPQIFVDAGMDTVLCGGGTVTLGGDPAAWGGTPYQDTVANPGGYSFLWSKDNPLAPNAIPNDIPNPTVTIGMNVDTVTYSLFVTDSIGCPLSSTITIVTEEAPIVENNFDPVIHCVNSFDPYVWYADSFIVSGVGPFSYTWLANGQEVGGNSSVLVAQPDTTTLYELIVSSANGCEGFDEFDITINPELFAVIDSAQQPDSCGGASGIIYGSSSGGAGLHTYQWYYIDDTGTQLLAGETNPTLNGAIAGTYRLVATDGACVDSIDYGLDDPFAPEITLVGFPDYCENDTLQLIVEDNDDTGQIWHDFVWSTNTLQSGIQDTLIQDLSAFGLGKHSINVYSDSAGCTSSEVFSLEVFETPVADISADTTEVCQGSPVVLSVPYNPFYTYVWGPGEYPDTSQIVVYPMDTLGNEYSLTIQNIVSSGPTCSGYDSILIDAYPVPYVDIDPYGSSACGVDSVFIGDVDSALHPTYTYQWLSDPIYDGLDTNAAGQFVLPLQNTTFYLQVEDPASGFGCSFYDTVVVEVGEPPYAFAGNDTMICAEEMLFLGQQWTPADTVNDALTYNWSSVPIGNPIPGDPGIWVSPSSTIEYQLEVVNDTTGCRALDTVFVEVVPLPTAEAGPDSLENCEGIEFTIGEEPIVNYIYDWSVVSSTTSINIPDPTAATQTFIPPVGEHLLQVEVIDTTSALACPDYDWIYLLVNGNPIANAGPDYPVVCIGDSVMVGDNTINQNNVEYNWSSSPLLPASAYVDSAYFYHIGSSDISFYLNVEDTLTGCFANDTMFIDVFTESANMIPTDTTVCFGDTVLYRITEPIDTARWTIIQDGSSYTPQNDSVLIIGTAGASVHVEYTDLVTGCLKKNDGMLSIHNTRAFALGGDTVCLGDTVNLFADITATSSDYTYYWLSDAFPDTIWQEPMIQVSPQVIESEYFVYVNDGVCQNYSSDGTNILLEIPGVAAGSDTNICYSDDIWIGQNQSDSLNTYYWRMADTVLLLAGPLEHDSIPIQVAPFDSTDYLLEAVGPLAGCSSYDTLSVGVYPLPEIDITANAKVGLIDTVVTLDSVYNLFHDTTVVKTFEVFKGQTVTLTASPQDYDQYIFSLTIYKESGDTLYDELVDGSSYFHKTTLPVEPTVRANVLTYNEYGCPNSDYLLFFDVGDIPNAFTPITVDGKNDIFLQGVQMKVLNRWGQTLYEGNEGWDGTFNGRQVAPGTYFYIIDIDYEGKSYIYKGSVLVVEGK